MIRIVFDTNVAVSALLWGGAPRQILDAVREQRAGLLVSEALLAELAGVLSRPKFALRLSVVGTTAADFVADYRALVELVQPVAIAPVITADPADDAVLACAVGGNAQYIISGDHHLLDLAVYQSVPIWDANRFLHYLDTHRLPEQPSEDETPDHPA